jgi:Flp pilus assembly protein TadD
MRRIRNLALCLAFGLAGCWALAILGRATEIADCDRSLALDPEWGDAYDTRDLARLRAGDPRNALADFDRALQLDPKLATSRYGRAVALERRGRAADGERDRVAAVALSPGIEARMRQWGFVP